MKYIVVDTPCYPNHWKIQWQNGGGRNHLFFEDKREAEKVARRMNGHKHQEKNV